MQPQGQHVMGELKRMRTQNEEDARAATARQEAAEEAAARAAAEARSHGGLRAAQDWTGLGKLL